MENRIDELFKRKERDILSVYYTAGFPERDDTLPLARALETSGVDMLEIGMPFSDPLADGPVIQQSSEVAIRNGMCIEVLFQQLSALRQLVTIPVVLMGYYNPVLQYGVKAFAERASAVGVDGVIIPDLPLDEYEANYQHLFETLNLRMIFLITPQTTEDRIRKIVQLSGGFIYAVSSASVTGSSGSAVSEREAYLKRLASMDLKKPVLVGFGIRTREDRLCVRPYAAGVIVGTAYIKAISEGDTDEQTYSFIQNLQV